MGEDGTFKRPKDSQKVVVRMKVGFRKKEMTQIQTKSVFAVMHLAKYTLKGIRQ